MKILITGGAGFIGSAVAERLAGRSLDVVILDLLSPQIHGDHPDQSFAVDLARRSGELRVGDVRSAEDWRAVMDGVTHILHLAAETGTGQSMYAVGHYCDTNVRGTSLLLDLLAQGGHRVEKVVVASSRAVYGEGKAKCPTHGAVYPHARRAEAMERGEFAPECPACGAATEPLPTDEESQLRPSSIYAITKLTQEQLVLTGCGALGIQAAALRYQNVYGPGQSLINPYTGIFSIFSAAMLDGREINIFEDGLESRDFVSIDDVAEATVRTLFSETVDGQVINIGSGVRTTVIDMVAALGRALNVRPAYRCSGDFRIGDIRHNVADMSRARDLLGFVPRQGLEKGIAAFADWAGAEPAKGMQGVGTYEDSLDEIRRRGLLKSNREV